MRAAAQYGIVSLFDGQDGAPGRDGNGITGTIISYAASSSGTTPPALDTAWGTSIPNVGYGMYLWTRIVIIYKDGTRNTVYSVSRNGTDGVDGADGSSVRIIPTNNAGTQEQIDTWGKEGAVLTYRAKSDISDLRIDDQVILRLTNTTTSSDAFILGVVTALNLPESKLSVRSLGLLRSGSDATVTRESICNAILQELMDTELDGIYSYASEGKLYIGINASAILAGVIDVEKIVLAGAYGSIVQGKGSTIVNGVTIPTTGMVLLGPKGLAGPMMLLSDAGGRLAAKDGGTAIYVSNGFVTTQNGALRVEDAIAMSLSGTTTYQQILKMLTGSPNAVQLSNTNINTAILGKERIRLQAPEIVLEGKVSAEKMYSGTLSSGSTSWEDKHSLYVIVGLVSVSRTSLVIPSDEITSSQVSYQVSDEANYKSFYLSKSGGRVTLAIRAGSGSIVGVYGFL